MKNLKLLVTSCGFLISANAFAVDVPMARTSVWQVPSVGQVQLKAMSLDAGLTRVCNEYRDLVGTTPGDDVFDRSDIQQMRSETPNVLDKVFTARFRLSVPGTPDGSSVLEDNANDMIESVRAKDLLPFYTLRLGKFMTNYQPNAAVIVFWKSKSLSAVSSAVGLKPMSVNVLPGSSSSMVVVQGKDTACDLLAGDVWLEYDARANLIPDKEDLEKATRYYSEFSLVASEVLAKKKTALGRASLFGFKMETFLTGYNLSNERKEEVLGYYVDNFFDAEMQPNQLWKKQEQGARVIVPQEVGSTVKVSVWR